MNNYTETRKKLIGGLLTLGALLICGTPAVKGQEPSTTYRTAPHDPFNRPVFVPKKKKKKTEKPAVGVVAPPSIQARIESYKSQKLRAMSAQQPAPKPTTAFLLSEFQVIGIFRTPRGYAAMVEATPIKLSYTIYPGENFYNGQLVAIEENRLVFRRETRYQDGRREVSVENKPLRQVDTIDQLSAAAAKVAPATESEKKQDPAIPPTPNN